MKKNEFVLYGLSNYESVIDEIIKELNAESNYFDIKLILTEALTNAFIHGNEGKVDKPIYLRYTYNNGNIVFEIQDSGSGFKDSSILDENISDEDLLNSSGRGLFLIKCMSDKVELKDNSLIIEKALIA